MPEARAWQLTKDHLLATSSPVPSCFRRNRMPASAKGIPRCSVCHDPLPWLVNADGNDFSNGRRVTQARAGATADSQDTPPSPRLQRQRSEAASDAIGSPTPPA